MRRWHQERQIALRHQRFHLKRVHGWPARPVDCECEFQVGRFRKRDGGDCGNARCYICHGDKLYRRPRRAEKRADLRLREGIADL